MQTAQMQWLPRIGWRPTDFSDAKWKPDVVFAFGSRNVLSDAGCMDALRTAFPEVPLVGCSTAGEICGTTVQDGTLSVTAVRFDHTQVRFAREVVSERSQAADAARAIAKTLDHEELVSVFVLSDGLNVHGPDLIAGLSEAFPPGVVVTGGMAADGSEFCRTLVLSGRGVENNTIVAVGFYGTRLKVGHGTGGGWDPFGPFRRVTPGLGKCAPRAGRKIGARSLQALSGRACGGPAWLRPVLPALGQPDARRTGRRAHGDLDRRGGANDDVRR